jgi:hypothetical protein
MRRVRGGGCVSSSAVIRVVCVLGTLVGSGAMTVDTHGVGRCVREFDVGRALLNETLHEQVYYWANRHEVREWQWQTTTASPELVARLALSPSEAAGLECVGIRYAAAIRIPEPFESLLVMWHMSVEIPLRVEKVVCRGNRVLYEDAVIEEPVLNRIQMSTKHVLVSDYELESSATTTLELPWYASVLESQVSAALDKSVGEKFDAVVMSLCEPRRAALRSKRRSLFGGWTGLRPAPQPFAGPLNATQAHGDKLAVPSRHAEPTRPLKPPHANASWVVILLPVDEAWPEPENASWVPADCDGPCDKKTGGPQEERVAKPVTKPVAHTMQLAVRRRSGHTSAKTMREESRSPSGGTTT